MDFLSFLIIIGIGQGIFTIVLIFTKASKRGFWPLLLITLFLIWILSEFLSVRWPHAVNFDLFYGTRFGSWLILGPLFLLYVKFATGEKIHSLYSIHFLPFITTIILIPLAQNPQLSNFQVDYGMLNVFNPFDIQYTFSQWFYSYIFIFQFLHLGAYLILSVRQINLTASEIENAFSDNTLLNVLWLKRFCYYLLFAMIIVVIFLSILFYTNIYRRQMDYMYALPVSFIIYALSFRLAKASWPKKAIKESKKKYAKSSLTSEQANELLQRLEEFVKNSKPHLNNGLKLTELAESLDVQTHHLSQVMNELLNKTFFDYINEKRVEEAKSLIANKSQLTLLEVAFRAGFNNKNSFTNAFKKHTGRTPSTFKQEFYLSEN